MEKYLNKKCFLAIETGKTSFYYKGEILEVTNTHIVIQDIKTNKPFTFRRDRILEIRELNAKELRELEVSE